MLLGISTISKESHPRFMSYWNDQCCRDLILGRRRIDSKEFFARFCIAWMHCVPTSLFLGYGVYLPVECLFVAQGSGAYKLLVVFDLFGRSAKIAHAWRTHGRPAASYASWAQIDIWGVLFGAEL